MMWYASARDRHSPDITAMNFPIDMNKRRMRKNISKKYRTLKYARYIWIRFNFENDSFCALMVCIAMHVPEM